GGDAVLADGLVEGEDGGRVLLGVSLERGADSRQLADAGAGAGEPEFVTERAEDAPSPEELEAREEGERDEEQLPPPLQPRERPTHGPPPWRACARRARRRRC